MKVKHINKRCQVVITFSSNHSFFINLSLYVKVRTTCLFGYIRYYTWTKVGEKYIHLENFYETSIDDFVEEIFEKRDLARKERRRLKQIWSNI